MEQIRYHHIIGVGNIQDWKEGRGSIYYIEDKHGERCVPVFTTPEKATSFGEANFNQPKAHMEMLESIASHVDTHAGPLTAGRFIIMPVEREIMCQAAARVDADYLIRDPGPEGHKGILRLSR